jgi:hypothetical protein
MNYDKLSRALRYYYDKVTGFSQLNITQIIEHHVQGSRKGVLFRFCLKVNSNF